MHLCEKISTLLLDFERGSRFLQKFSRCPRSFLRMLQNSRDIEKNDQNITIVMTFFENLVENLEILTRKGSKTSKSVALVFGHGKTRSYACWPRRSTCSRTSSLRPRRAPELSFCCLLLTVADS